MDVRFYPSAPTAVGSLPGADPTCLGPLDYYHCNKFDGENMYMGMNDNNQEFLSANQIQEMVHSDAASYDANHQVPLINRPGMLASHMSALSQSQLISQMGMRSGISQGSPSPPGSKSATPSPSSSTQEEETEAHYKVTGEKRPSAELGKKPKNQKKKKKKDPNEPQKPVSAYALFFRDTQAAIKGQNPNATFGDVSKIVASMWDSLGEEQKQAYKRKTEAAKKEYLKALAAYRASLVSKSSADQGEAKSVQPNQPAKMIPPKQPIYTMPPQASSPYPGLSAFLSPSDLQSYRGHPHPGLPRSLSSKSMLPSISASPPPSFQISPPLHQPLSLPHPQSSILNQPLHMQQAQQPSILSPSMALQVQPPMNASPPGQQDFSHISSEFPNSVGSRSPGASNPAGNSDWDSDYPSRECGINHCRPVDPSLLSPSVGGLLREPGAFPQQPLGLPGKPTQSEVPGGLGLRPRGRPCLRAGGGKAQVKSVTSSTVRVVNPAGGDWAQPWWRDAAVPEQLKS
uniref:TOX high mobility group box family member 2 n=1 Tax=Ornithorhynchus anatinus TaxID=9258 RepID=A0A6I8NNJ5_ORNAN